MTYEELQKELIKATKEKFTLKKNVIANIKNIAMNIAIEKKQKDNITEEIVNTALTKAQKICQQQIDTCPAGRAAALDQFRLEMDIISSYLPKQMSYEEVKTVVENFLVQFLVNNPGPINKGLVMREIMPKLKGKADGKIINQVVTELCNKTSK